MTNPIVVYLNLSTLLLNALLLVAFDCSRSIALVMYAAVEVLHNRSIDNVSCKHMLWAEACGRTT